MHHSDSPESSLQAILYIDQAGTKRLPPRPRHRLPIAAVVSICAAAAACAVGAVTLKAMQHVGHVATLRTPIRVVHPAARPRVALGAVPQLPRRLGVHRLAPPGHRLVVKPSPPKAVAAVPLPSATPPEPAAITPMHLSQHRRIAHRARVHRRLAAFEGPVLSHGTHVVYAAVTPLPAPVAVDPVITRLDAAPASIPEGSGTSLCVSARHATQLSISGVGEVNPLLLDCRHVSPNVTTTYTVWAVNNLGVTVSQNVTVTVTH